MNIFFKLKGWYSNIPRNHCQQPSWIKKIYHECKHPSHYKASLATMRDTTVVLLMDIVLYWPKKKTFVDDSVCVCVQSVIIPWLITGLLYQAVSSLSTLILPLSSYMYNKQIIKQLVNWNWELWLFSLTFFSFNRNTCKFDSFGWLFIALPVADP